jgi:hypothetical protein
MQLSSHAKNVDIANGLFSVEYRLSMMK